MSAARKRSLLRGLLALPLLFALGLPAARADAFGDWFAAVQNDDVRTMRALLARGFDPDTIEAHRYETGIILALRSGARQSFTLLVGLQAVNVEARSSNGDTPLMIASWKGNVEAVRALLARGVEVNRPGWTALHYAAGCWNTMPSSTPSRRTRPPR